MADENTKNGLIWINFGTYGLFRLLITNLNSKFRNSKWRIQYGGQKYKKRLDFIYVRLDNTML